MSFLPLLLAGALALPALSFAADAACACADLPPAQARALGVRFEAVAPAARLEAGVHARVVLRPDAQTVVSAPYAGAVPQVLVAVGQNVRAGQSVASLASPQLLEARRALAEAESQARLARQSLARDKALYEDGIIAASRWQATQARAFEASAMAEARRAELDASGVALHGNEARLRAPRAGVVTEVMVMAGARVESAAPLVRIADPSALELDMLLGREVPLPSAGDTVRVPARAASGQVIGVAPVGDGSAGMRVRAALARAGDLRVGESVNAVLELAQSPADAGNGADARLRVPAAAVIHWQGKSGVFVATAKGVRFEPVQVLAGDEAFATVLASLPAQARIAVSGLAALKSLLGGGE